MIDVKYQKYLTEGEDGLFAILSDTPEEIKNSWRIMMPNTMKFMACI